MPWHLENRDGKVCVIKDADGSVAGCHDSRTDAIKQQRALYANESRMASMYSELDAITEPWVEPKEEPKNGMASFLGNHELVKVVVGSEQDKALTASVVQALEVTNNRLESNEALTASLAAALQAISERPEVAPVVNVTTPEVNVDLPAPQVTVEAPQVTFQPPEIRVEAPQVTVNPEIVMPERSPATKTITFERDPLTGQVSSADVTES